MKLSERACRLTPEQPDEGVWPAPSGLLTVPLLQGQPGAGGPDCPFVSAVEAVTVQTREGFREPGPPRQAVGPFSSAHHLTTTVKQSVSFYPHCK